MHTLLSLEFYVDEDVNSKAFIDDMNNVKEAISLLELILETSIACFLSQTEDDNDKKQYATMEQDQVFQNNIDSKSNKKNVKNENSQPKTFLLLMRDANGNTPLHCLCGRGTALPIMLKTLFSFCSKIDDKFCNLSEDHDIPTSKQLISAKNDYGCTPLHFLAECQYDIESMEVMLNECIHFQPSLTTLSFPLEPSPRTKNPSLISNVETEGNVQMELITFPSQNEPTMTPSYRIYLKHGISEASTDNLLHPCLIQDDDGDTPLHFACSDGLNLKYIRLLLQHCPNAITLRNHEGKAPLDEIWSWITNEWHEINYDYNEDPLSQVLKTKYSSNNMDMDDINTLTEDIMERDSGEEFRAKKSAKLCQNAWELLNDYFEASSTGKVTSEQVIQTKENINASTKGNDWKPLHAMALLTHCDRDIVLFTIKMTLNHLKIFDDDGKLPIHVASSTPSKIASPLQTIVSLCDACNDLNKNQNGQNKPRETDKIFNLCSQKMASKDNPIYPLHLAIKSGKDINVIQELNKRYPDAFDEPEYKTGLFPWMLAAVESNNTVDVIYFLLRRNPELVRMGI